MSDYDICYDTGIYYDQVCAFCPHKEECSGSEISDNEDDE